MTTSSLLCFRICLFVFLTFLSIAVVVVVVVVNKRGISWRNLTTPRSLLFHCISLPLCEVKRPSQALCWPLGSTDCSPSLSQDLQALGTCCPRSCIFYKLRQDSHTQCVHCLLYHIHTVGILVVLCVQVCTGELSGLCGLVTALQQPWASIYSLAKVV
jgi:hypothetical protein